MKRIDFMVSDTENQWLKNKMKAEERSQTDIIRELIRTQMENEATVQPIAI